MSSLTSQYIFYMLFSNRKLKWKQVVGILKYFVTLLKTKIFYIRLFQIMNKNSYKAANLANSKTNLWIDLYHALIYLGFVPYIDLSSRSQMIFKIRVLRKSAKFTGKYLCRSLFLNTVVCWKPETLLKKRSRHLWWILQNFQQRYFDRRFPAAVSVSTENKFN